MYRCAAKIGSLIAQNISGRQKTDVIHTRFVLQGFRRRRWWRPKGWPKAFSDRTPIYCIHWEFALWNRAGGCQSYFPGPQREECEASHG
jgi:hypothetical protein